MKPIISKHQKDITKKYRVYATRDIVQKQIKELVEIRSGKAKGTITQHWVYFPWNGNLVHLVGQKELNELRTNRNRNIITPLEQKKLLQASVGVVGLSVGAEVAVNLAYSGIGHTFKLADFDIIQTTNLNRLKVKVSDIGTKKIDSITQRVYEIDPYANILPFNKKLIMQDFGSFFTTPKLDVVIEECDDFELKIRLRIAARKYRVPVITLTSLGDNVLVDIERYDLDKHLALFHGVLGDVPEKILSKRISELNKIKYAILIVGINHIPTNVLASLLEINKTLVGRPQVNSTVTIASGITSLLLRKLLLGKNLPSKRVFVSLDQILQLDQKEDINKRKDILKKIENILRNE